jgi:hypothetical protein
MPFSSAVASSEGQHRRCPFADRMARPANGVRRIRGHDLAHHQPVEQHPDTGQMLLDGRRGPFARSPCSCSI